MPDGDSSHWLLPDEEDLVECFEQAWLGPESPDVARFAKEHAADYDLQSRPRLLAELIKVDLEYRWRAAGNSTVSVREDETEIHDGLSVDLWHIEDYGSKFPELIIDVSLVAEEYRVRHRFGDAPRHEEFLDRFDHLASSLPRHLAEIDRQLRAAAGRRAGSQKADASDVILAPASQPTSPPSIIGRYAVERLLGEGAFGKVYLAFDPQLERHVAIKVAHERLAHNPEHLRRQLDEARKAATISHPGLVTIYDVQHDDANCFLVMEYIEGDSLADHLYSDLLECNRAIGWLAEVADALHEAHKHGVFHCDLKPANILIDSEGRARITDFGLAVRESQQRAHAWQVAGTPSYMAPEQIRGEAHRFDGRVDLWSLGVILYEVLTRRRPFQGQQSHELFEEILHRDPKPPRQIDDAIPIGLEKACLRCLAKSTSDRYTTARDFAEELRRCMALGRRDSPLAFSSTSSIFELRTSHGHADRPIGNLPTTSDTIVGRNADLAELSKLLADASLVTLIGFGGLGKTRLACEAAHGLLAEFPGGCWFADLSAATSVDGIAQVILATFGVTPSEGSSLVDQVSSVLEYREPLLLIVDNFEQAIEHADATIGRWRNHAPHVKFLATSREPLALAGERQYELGPLTTPEQNCTGVESLAQCESVRLFVERATECDARFRLDSTNAGHVGRICRQLEGIPLAIELAAARTKLLSPAQIVDKLDQKFQLLRSSRRDLAVRQQTLENTIQWSYDLLSVAEQAAFVQLSVFTAGFFLEAAEATVDMEHLSGAPLVFDLIQALRDRCLLRGMDSEFGPRFTAFQSIRDYGVAKREQTLSDDENQALQRRAALYLTEYSEQWQAKIHARDGQEALERLALERDNLFALQDWALAANEPEIAARLGIAFDELLAVRGPAEERRTRLEAVSRMAKGPLAAQLSVALSQACQGGGDVERAEQLAAAARQLAEPQGDSYQLALALRQQGEIARAHGRHGEARDLFRESADVAERIGDRHGLALSLAAHGFLLAQNGHLAEALEQYQRASALAEEISDESVKAIVLRRGGQVLLQRGRLEEAAACFERAATIARRRGDRRALHLALTSRGAVYAESGHYDRAIACYAEAEQEARTLGEKRALAVNQGNRGLALADQGEFELALACYETAERINLELGAPAGVALNVGNRGAALAGLGRLNEALQELNEAERLHEQLENPGQIAINRGDRGIVYLRLGQPEEARDDLNSALQLLSELGIIESVDYFCFVAALTELESGAANDAAVKTLGDQARALADRLGIQPDDPRPKVRAAWTSLGRA
ncbi:MAG: protein kinase [Planctomycetales bacterium]|nr:protein kinase [Planctomycetales bacterium]